MDRKYIPVIYVAKYKEVTAPVSRLGAFISRSSLLQDAPISFPITYFVMLYTDDLLPGIQCHSHLDMFPP